MKGATILRGRFGLANDRTISASGSMTTISPSKFRESPFTNRRQFSSSGVVIFRTLHERLAATSARLMTPRNTRALSPNDLSDSGSTSGRATGWAVDGLSWMHACLSHGGPGGGSIHTLPPLWRMKKTGSLHLGHVVGLHSLSELVWDCGMKRPFDPRPSQYLPLT